MFLSSLSVNLRLTTHLVAFFGGEEEFFFDLAKKPFDLPFRFKLFIFEFELELDAKDDFLFVAFLESDFDELLAEF